MEVFMKIRLRIPIFRRHLKTTSMSVCTYFSQALTEKEAKQEAEYVLDLADKYGWDVTLPIVIDREKEVTTA